MPHPDMDDVLQDGGGGGSLFSSSSFSLQMNNTSSSYIDYGSQLVAEPKKVKAQHLSYARVAKKVDVKRLKDNIWKRVKDITEVKKKQSCRSIKKKEILTPSTLRIM